MQFFISSWLNFSGFSAAVHTADSGTAIERIACSISRGEFSWLSLLEEYSRSERNRKNESGLAKKSKATRNVQCGKLIDNHCKDICELLKRNSKESFLLELISYLGCKCLIDEDAFWGMLILGERIGLSDSGFPAALLNTGLIHNENLKLCDGSRLNDEVCRRIAQYHIPEQYASNKEMGVKSLIIGLLRQHQVSFKVHGKDLLTGLDDAARNACFNDTWKYPSDNGQGDALLRYGNGAGPSANMRSFENIIMHSAPSGIADRNAKCVLLLLIGLLEKGNHVISAECDRWLDGDFAKIVSLVNNNNRLKGIRSLSKRSGIVGDDTLISELEQQLEYLEVSFYKCDSADCSRLLKSINGLRPREIDVYLPHNAPAGAFQFLEDPGDIIIKNLCIGNVSLLLNPPSSFGKAVPTTHPTAVGETALNIFKSIKDNEKIKGLLLHSVEWSLSHELLNECRDYLESKVNAMHLNESVLTEDIVGSISAWSGVETIVIHSYRITEMSKPAKKSAVNGDSKESVVKSNDSKDRSDYRSELVGLYRGILRIPSLKYLLIRYQPLETNCIEELYTGILREALEDPSANKTVILSLRKRDLICPGAGCKCRDIYIYKEIRPHSEIN